MKFVILAVFVGIVYSQMIELPASAIQGVQNAGIQTLNDEIHASKRRLMDAIEVFKPINETCNNLLMPVMSKCAACVESRSRDRADQVCQQSEKSSIGDKIHELLPILFPGSSIKALLIGQFGGKIIDVGLDIGEFVVDKVGDAVKGLGKAVGGLAKGIVKGVGSIGKGISRTISRVGRGVFRAVGSFGSRVVRHVGSFGSRVVRSVGRFASRVGRFARRVFGKRNIVRVTEPGCEDFKNDPEDIVMFYSQPRFCEDCGFDPDQDCPGYKEAVEDVEVIDEQESWLFGIQNTTYTINKIAYNPSAIDSNGNFNNVVVSLNLFGKDFVFSVDQAINPYIPSTAGPIVASQALEEYKKAA